MLKRLEPGSYKSLLCRFGLQFVLFVIGVMVASAILYAIDRGHEIERPITFSMARVENRRVKRVENLLNRTGVHVVRDFGDHHNVEIPSLHGFIHNITRVLFFGTVEVDLSKTFVHFRRKEKGIDFLQAYILTLSTVTTVGKWNGKWWEIIIKHAILLSKIICAHILSGQE